MSGIRGTIVAGALAAAMVSAGEAWGQELLKPIEQAVADIDLLSVSLRDLSVDLQQPTDFAKVYRVPGRADLLMRVNGGVYAVFPQSLYAETEEGAVALVPAGTVFYLGGAALSGLGEGEGLRMPPADRTGLRVDGRVVTKRIAGEDEGGRPEVRRASGGGAGRGAWGPPAAATRFAGEERGEAGPAIAADAAYRSRRIGELMRRAAAAMEKQADGASSEG